MCIVYTRLFKLHNISCHSINDLYFLSYNSSNGNTTYTSKMNRHIMNNQITVGRYGTFTGKFDNHVFKCSNENEHVAKESYFKIYTFMTDNNENKLLCYEPYSHKIRFNIMNYNVLLLLLLLLISK